MKIVHVAGPLLRIEHRRIQRCALCGAPLIDMDITRTAVPAGDDPEPKGWGHLDLVEVEGNRSSLIQAEPSAEDPSMRKIPDGMCVDQVTLWMGQESRRVLAKAIGISGTPFPMALPDYVRELAQSLVRNEQIEFEILT